MMLQAASKAVTRGLQDTSIYSLCDDNHDEDSAVQGLSVSLSVCLRLTHRNGQFLVYDRLIIYI